jgi:hypothetical protein
MTEPLDLMVHSLPTAEHPVAAAAAVSGRMKLLALLLLCSLPVLAAYWVYFFVRPAGTAAMGELIQPVRPLPTQSAKDLDGATHALAELKGQWLLVSVASGACPADCQRRLFLQRQLRSMLGKDKDRVDGVWLLADDAPVAPSLRAHLDGMQVLTLSAQAQVAWLPVATDRKSEDYIYVIDPLGNAMMRFPAQLDAPGAAKAKRDLEKLLRASASWDGPGR